MNMSRFREIIEKLLAAEKQYEIQEILQQLRRDLQEMVNQAQQPGPQTAFAATLSRLRRNVGQLRSSFSPAEWKRFDEIGASDQSLADISQDIEKEMAGNPLTP